MSVAAEYVLYQKGDNSSNQWWRGSKIGAGKLHTKGSLLGGGKSQVRGGEVGVRTEESTKKSTI